MRFRTTLDVRGILLSVLVAAGALTGWNIIVGDLGSEDLVLVIGFIWGQLTCLWIAWDCRDRPR
jgi:hypothetical protein